MVSNEPCHSKIVFIGLDEMFSLPPMIPYIQRLHEEVPSSALDFELFPITTPQTLDQNVNALEKLVTKYYRQGYRYIGLPTQATLLRPFILGTGGNLDNIPIDRRWPDVYFMVQDLTITAAEYPNNVYRFFDINTLLDRRLLMKNIENFVHGTGRAYVIYQGGGDASSTETTNAMLATLLDMGMTTNAFEIGLPDNQFDDSMLDEAVEFIQRTVPPPPAQSVIIHIVNPLLSEAYTQAGLDAGLFSSFGNRAVHYSYAFGYWPAETTIPVELLMGLIPVEGIPSMEAASIGIPLMPEEYYSFPYLLTFLDAYLWAATCQKTDGINDKQLKFDSTQTRISYYIANFKVDPNSIQIRMGPLYFNPRWFHPENPVVPI